MNVIKLLNPDKTRTIYRVYESNSLPFEIINEFLRYQEKRQFAPNTIRASAYDLISYFNFLTRSDLVWSDINTGTFTDYIHYLRFSTSKESILAIPNSKLTRSERTISRMLSSIISFYRYQYYSNGLVIELANTGILNKSSNSHKDFMSFALNDRTESISKRKPIQLSKYQISKAKPKTVTEDQVEVILAACKNDRDRLLVLLLIETGMRIGQVLQLKHEDIECWNSRLKITYRLDNPNEVYAKSRDDYYVDLTDNWIRLYTDFLINDAGDIETEYVFTSIYSNNPEKITSPYSYSAVIDMFSRLSKNSGIKITPHMFRHTHATTLLKNGVSIDIVTRRLGHKSSETTKGTYEHLTANDMREAIAEAMAKSTQSTTNKDDTHD
jgi:integrase/recombinase XerD